MMEHNFLVGVCRYIFPVEFGVEFRRDGLNGFRLAKDKGKGNSFILLLFALLRQRLGTHNLGIGVGLVPGPKEDVVLWVITISIFVKDTCVRSTYFGIECSNVPDFSKLGHLALDIVGQCDWGEDGQSA